MTWRVSFAWTAPTSRGRDSAAGCMAAPALWAAATGYTPDDGTQGYTPYFYKMDVPVRVRNTISYGRAWQAS